jgi:PASTA domain
MRRLLFLAAMIAALALAAIGLAAGGDGTTPPPPSSAARLPAEEATMVVPDLRNEAFVFAKEQLQDGGFAWKVVGATPGYAANIVVSQSPAPGTKVVDTGAPLITVTLEKNKQYKASGVPENTSPYSGTATRPAS